MLKESLLLKMAGLLTEANGNIFMNRDKEFFREVLSSLGRRKKILFLTGMGVFGAIFLLIILMAAGNGLENGVYNRFKSVKTTCLYFSGGTARIAYKNLPASRPVTLQYSDYLMAKKNFSHAGDIISCRMATNEIKELAHERARTTAFFAAVDEGNMVTHPVMMLTGRYISDLDCKNREKIMVIGKELSKDLFDNGSALGKQVLMGDCYYRIAGVFESLKEGEAAASDNNTVLLPITVYNAVYNNSLIGTIEINTEDNARYTSLKNDVTIWLKNLKQVHPQDASAIRVTDTQKDFFKYTSLFRNIRYFLWFVALAMLFMGLLNISNVMMITVNDRMREIGIRKAMGATPGSIKTLFITETLLLTLFAGLTGIAAGYGAVKLLAFFMNRFNWNSEFFMHPYIHTGAVLLAVAILLIAGVLSGLVPAAKAARIKPVEVLRHE
jgi:putative ABC transport system permease protein